MPWRGLEKDLVILDKGAYRSDSGYTLEPAIVSVIQWGTGWIDVRMNDGHSYKRMGGTLSWRYNNPGNIKFGKFARASGAIGRGWGSHGGHAVFPTYAVGHAAKKKLLFTPVRKYYNYTLRDAISLYAPASDNNRPDIYARFIMRATPGVTLSTRLKDFNHIQQEQMLRAMERFEGWKPGKVVRIA